MSIESHPVTTHKPDANKHESQGDCPRCGHCIPNDEEPGAHPGAASRVDDETEICSACGLDEALVQFRTNQARLGVAMSTPPVSDDETVRLAEAVATNALGGLLGNGTAPTQVARMTVLVAHQLMAIAQVLCAEASLNFVVIYREELERAGRWHDEVARMQEQRGRAS